MPPLYSVTTTLPPQKTGEQFPVQFVRMVDARNRAQAIAHVVAAEITAEVIDAKEAVRLANSGVKIEQANGAA